MVKFAPAHKPPMICDADVSLRVMQELGLTEVKRDADGKELREVDWEKTYAINTRSNHIYLNVKGRDKHTMADGTVIDGIIDPKDQYEWEEEIMTRLYGYKDKKQGNVLPISIAKQRCHVVRYGWRIELAISLSGQQKVITMIIMMHYQHAMAKVTLL